MTTTKGFLSLYRDREIREKCIGTADVRIQYDTEKHYTIVFVIIIYFMFFSEKKN